MDFVKTKIIAILVCAVMIIPYLSSPAFGIAEGALGSVSNPVTSASQLAGVISSIPAGATDTIYIDPTAFNSGSNAILSSAIIIDTKNIIFKTTVPDEDAIIKVSGNFRHIILNTNGDMKLTFENVVLQGLDTNADGTVPGGGLHIATSLSQLQVPSTSLSGTVTLEGIVVKNCHSSSYRGNGGGIYAEKNLVILSGSITKNSSKAVVGLGGSNTGDGGGVFSVGNLTISPGAGQVVTISDNQTTAASGSTNGGGILSLNNTQDALKIVPNNGGIVRISGNRTYGSSGGGIFVRDSNSKLSINPTGQGSLVEISNNGRDFVESDSFPGGNLYGGGMQVNGYLEISPADKAKVDIIGNKSNNFGGAIYATKHSTLTQILENATVISPTGGGVVTMEGNQSSQGGAIYTYESLNGTLGVGGQVVIKPSGDGSLVKINNNGIIHPSRSSTGGGISLFGPADISPFDNAKVEINKNRAKGSGGGLYAYTRYGSDLEIKPRTGGVVEMCENEAQSTGVGGAINLSCDSSTTYPGMNFNVNTDSTSSVLIDNNKATDGAGIYAYSHKVNINIDDNVILSNNKASNNGGGIYYKAGNSNYASSITLRGNVKILSNSGKTDGTGQKGGGIYAGALSNITIGKSLQNTGTVEFINNTINSQGGGIYTEGVLSADSCTFKGNKTFFDVDETSGNGGGIFISQRSNLTVSNVLFTLNSAVKGYHMQPGVDDTDIALHTSKVVTTNYTSPFEYTYNNFDVNYRNQRTVYVANFITYGGTPVPDEQMINPGGLVVRPGINPQKDSETFIGWYTSSDTLYDFNTPVNANITLYAKYSDVSYPVSYKVTGPAPATHTAVPATVSYTQDAAVTVAGGLTTSETTSSGKFGTWTFSGWSTADATITSGAFAMPGNAVELSGTWTFTERRPGTGGGSGGSGGTNYTLTFETNGGSPVKSVTASRGTVIVIDQTTSKEGHIFVGWYYDKELTVPVTKVTLNSDITVYANWQSDSEKEPMLNDTDHFAYIIGYPEGYVRPTNNITRAEVATIFFRLLTERSRNDFWMSMNSFTDVNAGMWYNNAVSTMANAGIIYGYDDGIFDGNRPITRAEFAAIAARFSSDKYVGNDKFSDIAGHWAAELINRAASEGWILGYPDGTFMPDQYITRAEAMTLINRVLKRDLIREGDMLPSMVIWPDNLSGQWYYTAVQEATNSHDYIRNSVDGYEHWTAIKPVYDWASLEKEWAKVNTSE